MKNIIVTILLSSISCTSFAQFARVEGNFGSSTVELRTILLDKRAGIVAASATVIIGACSGSVEGIGKMSDRTLKFTPYVKLDGGENCEVTAEFSNDWKLAKVLERNCTPYHGAACGFEGQAVMKKK